MRKFETSYLALCEGAEKPGFGGHRAIPAIDNKDVNEWQYMLGLAIRKSIYRLS